MPNISTQQFTYTFHFGQERNLCPGLSTVWLIRDTARRLQSDLTLLATPKDNNGLYISPNMSKHKGFQWQGWWAMRTGVNVLAAAARSTMNGGIKSLNGQEGNNGGNNQCLLALVGNGELSQRATSSAYWRWQSTANWHWQTMGSAY